MVNFNLVLLNRINIQKKRQNNNTFRMKAPYEYPSSSHYQKILTQYLTTRLRVSTQVENLVMLLSVSKFTLNPRISRQVVYEGIEELNDLMQIFKYAMLLQRSVVSGCVTDSLYILQLLFTQLQASHSCKGMAKDGAEFFKEKVLKLYFGYLEKRIYDDLHHQIQPNLCQFNPKSTRDHPQQVAEKQKQVFTLTSEGEPKPTQEKFKENLYLGNPEIGDDLIERNFQQSFYLINLISRAISFCPAMLSLIRYFGGHYGCITDFNITMAMDLNQVYQRLILQAKQIERRLKINEAYDDSDSLAFTTTKMKLLQDARLLFSEIQKINEGLYLVYFNYYNINYLRNHTPSFINTDEVLALIDKAETQLKKKLRNYWLFEVSKSRLGIEQKSMVIIQQLEEEKKNNFNRSSRSAPEAKTLNLSLLEQKCSPLGLSFYEFRNNSTSTSQKCSGVAKEGAYDEQTGFQLDQSEDEQSGQQQGQEYKDRASILQQNLAILIEMSLVVEGKGVGQSHMQNIC